MNVWPSVVDHFRRASFTYLLLDFDGTLTPIMGRPQDAVLSDDVRQLLRRLKARDNILVGVISGRSLNDLRQRVSIEDVVYAGNHGLEIEGGGHQYLHAEAVESQESLERMGRDLDRELAAYPGVVTEHKGLTLSVHYRLTPDELAERVESTFNSVVDAGVKDGLVKVTHGKKVLELRPNVDWDKGKAITMILEDCDEGSLAVYFGDDLTDEAGFSAVQAAGGLGIFVGPTGRPTTAQYRLESPEEVAEVLKLLLEMHSVEQ